eukprot:CAMPEP_0179001282 /NCGR_PEP_ID=MMETSP0795-20121207/11251_1 /TAXON_ID=88552 /ORGANISM="Amoebophrya sp., Strain Ameob2" /LENGTH=693 /DNA_ID=CAMNT_0020694593 /DNA_START=80 /DNA_END=2158 /DNA_ORIENTATION=+
MSDLLQADDHDEIDFGEDEDDSLVIVVEDDDEIENGLDAADRPARAIESSKHQHGRQRASATASSGLTTGEDTSRAAERVELAEQQDTTKKSKSAAPATTWKGTNPFANHAVESDSEEDHAVPPVVDEEDADSQSLGGASSSKLRERSVSARDVGEEAEANDRETTTARTTSAAATNTRTGKRRPRGGRKEKEKRERRQRSILQLQRGDDRSVDPALKDDAGIGTSAQAEGAATRATTELEAAAAAAQREGGEISTRTGKMKKFSNPFAAGLPDGHAGVVPEKVEARAAPTSASASAPSFVSKTSVAVASSSASAFIANGTTLVTTLKRDRVRSSRGVTVFELPTDSDDEKSPAGKKLKSSKDNAASVFPALLAEQEERPQEEPAPDPKKKANPFALSPLPKGGVELLALGGSEEAPGGGVASPLEEYQQHDHKRPTRGRDEHRGRNRSRSRSGSRSPFRYYKKLKQEQLPADDRIDNDGRNLAENRTTSRTRTRGARGGSGHNRTLHQQPVSVTRAPTSYAAHLAKKRIVPLPVPPANKNVDNSGTAGSITAAPAAGTASASTSSSSLLVPLPRNGAKPQQNGSSTFSRFVKAQRENSGSLDPSAQQAVKPIPKSEHQQEQQERPEEEIAVVARWWPEKKYGFVRSAMLKSVWGGDAFFQLSPEEDRAGMDLRASDGTIKSGSKVHFERVEW